MASAKELMGRSQPFIKKVWNTYSFQRGVVQQQLSPFEANVTGSLMTNALEKMCFKVMVRYSVRCLTRVCWQPSLYFSRQTVVSPSPKGAAECVSGS